MSSDLVKRLRLWGEHGLTNTLPDLVDAADRIEALEGENASSALVMRDITEKSLENKLRAEAAEARAERLRAALRAIEQADYYGCVSEFAAKALEDKQ